MKKIISLLLVLFFIANAKARSVRIRIFNNSKSTLWFTEAKMKGFGLFCAEYGNSYTVEPFPYWGDETSAVKPGTVASFKTGSSVPFCGWEGYVEYHAKVNNKTYQFHITYNDPFIGGNEFLYSASAPFIMKHLSGGDGGDVDISFELTGGPDPVAVTPPPPPFQLPVSGNKAITGQFYWDSKETGIPINGNLLGAFKVDILAPTQLTRKSDGTGSDSYDGVNGTFSNLAILNNAKIVFHDARTETNSNPAMAPNVLSPIRIIKFTVSNLPSGIPLSIAVNTTNANWSIGEATPPRPVNKPNARWMAFIHEKEIASVVAKYQVYGAWFNGDGTFSSDLVSGLTKEMIDKIKARGKPPVFTDGQADFKKNNLIRPGTDIKPTQKINPAIKMRPVQKITNRKTT